MNEHAPLSHDVPRNFAARQHSYWFIFLASGLLLTTKAVAQQQEAIPDKVQVETQTILNSVSAYEQRINSNPDQVNAVYEEILKAFKDNTGDSRRFAELTSTFITLTTRLEQSDRGIPTATANRVSDELISLFLKNRKRYPERGYFVTEFAAKYSSSSSSINYLRDILSSQDKNISALQKKAYIALAWRKTNSGNQKIFEILQDAYSRDRTNFAALSAMNRLNPTATRPELLLLIRDANEIRAFNKAVTIACEADDTELIRIAAHRATQLPHGQGYDKDPSFGFTPVALYKHIERSNGAALKEAFAVMELNARLRIRAYPTLASKIASDNPSSRQAATEVLLKMMQRGLFISAETEQLLQSRLKTEKDTPTREKIEQALLLIKQHPRK